MKKLITILFIITIFGLGVGWGENSSKTIPSKEYDEKTILESKDWNEIIKYLEKHDIEFIPLMKSLFKAKEMYDNKNIDESEKIIKNAFSQWKENIKYDEPKTMLEKDIAYLKELILKDKEYNHTMMNSKSTEFIAILNETILAYPNGQRERIILRRKHLDLKNVVQFKNIEIKLLSKYFWENRNFADCIINKYYPLNLGHWGTYHALSYPFIQYVHVKKYKRTKRDVFLEEIEINIRTGYGSGIELKCTKRNDKWIINKSGDWME